MIHCSILLHGPAFLFLNIQTSHGYDWLSLTLCHSLPSMLFSGKGSLSSTKRQVHMEVTGVFLPVAHLAEILTSEN